MTQFFANWPDGAAPATRTPVTPVAATPSGSSCAQTLVQAEAVATGAGSIMVALRRDLATGRTVLEVEEGDGLENDGSRGCPVLIKLNSPDTVRALTSALLQLMTDPTGAQVLATIVPPAVPASDEPPAASFDTRSLDDDDDENDEPWKAR